MNKFLLLILLIIPQIANATLTANNVPVTKTGGSSPVLQNSDITDTLGVSVAIGVPTTVNGSAVCTTGSVCSGYQPAGSYLTGNQNITLTGYVTGSGTTSIATSMPTVNSNVGSFTNSSITVNAQGQVTAASSGSGGSASITRATFTNASLSAGVLTITHNLALASPCTVFVNIFNNNKQQILPDSVTGSTNSVSVDLTSYGTITGQWGYAYVAG